MTRPKNRAERLRRNRIAKELASAKYRQRKVPPKREEHRQFSKRDLMDGRYDEES